MKMIDFEGLKKEFSFQTARSSGAGGQNVNKVSSKVTLNFHIENSWVLSSEEKELLRTKFPGRVNKEDILHITSSKDRSQLINKHNVIDKFFELLAIAFEPEIPRVKTKPTRSSKVRKMVAKQEHSAKKQMRKKLRSSNDNE